jgi:hypothetical protein
MEAGSSWGLSLLDLYMSSSSKSSCGHPAVYVSVPISSSHKDTRWPHLTKSHLFGDSVSKYSYILRSWRLGLQHTNFGWQTEPLCHPSPSWQPQQVTTILPRFMGLLAPRVLPVVSHGHALLDLTFTFPTDPAWVRSWPRHGLCRKSSQPVQSHLGSTSCSQCFSETTVGSDICPLMGQHWACSFSHHLIHSHLISYGDTERIVISDGE